MHPLYLIMVWICLVKNSGATTGPRGGGGVAEKKGEMKELMLVDYLYETGSLMINWTKCQA